MQLSLERDVKHLEKVFYTERLQMLLSEEENKSGFFSQMLCNCYYNTRSQNSEFLTYLCFYCF